MSDQTHCIICNNHLRGHGIWCKTCAAFMHVKYSGLNRSSDHDDYFSCLCCTNDLNPAIANRNETVTATPDPWSNPTPELKDKLRAIYSQVVHCKPVIMIFAKSRVGFNFIETLKRTFNSLIETEEKTYAKHAKIPMLNTDAKILIDVEKAFNSLYRNLALKNNANICPSILPAIQNSYSNPSNFFVNKKNLFYLEKEPHKETH